MPSVMITSGDLSAAGFQMPRCGPGKNRCRSCLPVVVDGAAVNRADLAILRDHREDDPAPQVLVARVAQEAQPRQPLADRRAFLALVVRQPQAQRAIDEAELEGRDRLLARDAAFFEIGERGRVLL